MGETVFEYAFYLGLYVLFAECVWAATMLGLRRRDKRRRRGG